MKILITTDRYLPPVNGAVTSVFLPVHGPRWHEVRILTLSEALYTHMEEKSFGDVWRLYSGARIGAFHSRQSHPTADLPVKERKGI